MLVTNNIFGHEYPVVLDTETDDLTAKYDSEVRLNLVGLLFLCDIDEYKKGSYHYFTTDEFRVVHSKLDSVVTWVIHNASFDVPVLRIRGMNLSNYYCTMVGAHSWDTALDSYSLDELTGEKIDLAAELDKAGYDVTNKEDVYAWYGKGDSFVDELFVRYLAADVNAVHVLYNAQLASFATDTRATHCLLKINQPYIERIIELESGVLIDTSRLDEVELNLSNIQREAKERIDQFIVQVPGDTKEYKNGVYKSNGTVTYNHCQLVDFNPGSSDHVTYALTKLYNWKPTVLSDKTGKPSTKTEVLEALAYPLVECLLEYQKATKLLQFAPAIASRLDTQNVLRPSYNQTATRTTRLSCSQPNIQQIPSRDKAGKYLRSLFVPRQGKTFVVGDESGFQLRIAAAYMEYYFEEPALSKNFIDKLDVHEFFALIYGITRKISKNVTFGYMFGAGAPKMAATASRGNDSIIPVSTIKGALSSLEEKLPALPGIKALVVQYARENGGVFHDWCGQRYNVPELLSKDQGTRASGERKAFNYWVQGFEATLFRFIQNEAASVGKKYGASLVIAVHDEVCYEVDNEYAQLFADEMTSIYTTRAFLPPEITSGLTFEAEFALGNSWLDAKG